ncbi:uncharacterized protein UTRI_03357 [Ustilago trichophora]|uniref:Reverse transcriptase domain-containing protein n=1 Tax=Ustilago trichophora TaxID=86804 RepID=A0A5C3E637_9BASI|nr:uncharacterized protein UTRI_03357 [Ustilago trichophora]
MSKHKTCRRCKSSLPTSSFIGARGGQVQTCSDCRALLRRGSHLTTPSNLSSPPSTNRSCGSSRHSSSPLSAHMAHSTGNIGNFASASSVAALEQQVERRFDHLSSQLSSLLSAFQASRVSQPPSPAPVPPSALPISSQALSPLPQAQSAAAPALTSAGQPDTVGELPFLSISRCFAWVPANVVSLVERNQLRPKQLVKLCNPESRVSKEPTQEQGFTLGSGGLLSLVQETTDTRTSNFVKAIPNIAALAQVWLVYTAIRVHHTGDTALNEALLAYLEHLIECDHLYTWRAVADYHLAICRQCFGTGAVQAWSSYDPQISSRVLFPFLKAPLQPTIRGESSNTGARQQPAARAPNRLNKSIAVAGSFDPCRRFNAAEAPNDAVPLLGGQVSHQPATQEGELMGSLPHFGGPHRPQPVSSTASSRPETISTPSSLPGRLYNSPPESGRSSAPSSSPGQHSIAPPPLVLPPQAPPRSGLLIAPSTSPGRPTIAPSSPGQHTTAPPGSERSSAPGSSPLLDSLVDGIVDLPPDLAASTLLSLITGHQPPPPRPNTSCAQPIFHSADVPATIGSLLPHLWHPFLELYPDPALATQLRGALQHGIKLGYDGPLRHSTRLDVTNLPMDNEDLHHLRREIDVRLQEGRLRPVADPAIAQLVCSPVGVVPKPHSEKRRTIYHLSHPRQPGKRLPSVNDGIHSSFVSIHYENLDTIMEFIREHPSASLWKADLEDAFRHIILAESDARLMGIHFDGRFYQECALAFGGRSLPFLFNLFAEFLHWLTTFALQAVSPSLTSHSDVSHYLDDFFGASDASVKTTTPIQVLSLATAALGFRLSHRKTVWNTTKLKILGIELDPVAQTASITQQHRHRIIQLCSRIVERDRASLLELQQVAGHLQFVTKATRTELSWWIHTLNSLDGISLLQPSPLIIEHIWTDASKRCIGGHWGSMEAPYAVFSRELSRRHRQKDIRFLEALAVLEALRLFSPRWTGPRRVVVHVDNENVEYRLRKGSIRDPQTQVLFREIFSLCLQQHIDLVPVRVSSEANVLADALSPTFTRASGLSLSAATLLWNGLAPSTRARSSAIGADFTLFATSLTANPFPASPTLLIEWVAHHHTAGKSYNTLKSGLSALKSIHVDLGLSTMAFADERLKRTVRGFKRLVGAPLPVAKLPITLPLLRQLVRALYTTCPSRHDRRMFRAAFCLAFACFLRSGELTWEAEGPNVLTVAAVSFAQDHSHVTVTLQASKTDPFRQGATLTAPAVNLSTCAVSALRVICYHREPQQPLFMLDGGQPFTCASFVAMLCRCLQACSIPPALYSGHSFRRGAATWAASNGVDADTIRGLGRWQSDCFRRYVDKLAADRAATTKAALYSNADAPLRLNVAAWRDV